MDNITPNQAAAILGMSRGYVYQLVKDGKLANTSGQAGHVAVSHAAVMALVNTVRPRPRKHQGKRARMEMIFGPRPEKVANPLKRIENKIDNLARSFDRLIKTFS